MPALPPGRVRVDCHLHTADSGGVAHRDLAGVQGDPSGQRQLGDQRTGEADRQFGSARGAFTVAGPVGQQQQFLRQDQR